MIDVSGNVTRLAFIAPVTWRRNLPVFGCSSAFRTLTGPALAPPAVWPAELGSSSVFPGRVSGTSPDSGRFLT